MDRSELLPDVERTIHFLIEMNQYVTLGSASKNARPILEKTNLIEAFDAIVDGNDVIRSEAQSRGVFKGRYSLQIHNPTIALFLKIQ